MRGYIIGGVFLVGLVTVFSLRYSSEYPFGEAPLKTGQEVKPEDFDGVFVPSQELLPRDFGFIPVDFFLPRGWAATESSGARSLAGGPVYFWTPGGRDDQLCPRFFAGHSGIMGFDGETFLSVEEKEMLGEEFEVSRLAWGRYPLLALEPRVIDDETPFSVFVASLDSTWVIEINFCPGDDPEAVEKIWRPFLKHTREMDGPSRRAWFGLNMHRGATHYERNGAELILEGVRSRRSGLVALRIEALNSGTTIYTEAWRIGAELAEPDVFEEALQPVLLLSLNIDSQHEGMTPSIRTRLPVSLETTRSRCPIPKSWQSKKGEVLLFSPEPSDQNSSQSRFFAKHPDDCP
ncbi:MAG: hypothetical protein EA369_08550 [Bradymonadales bacterium]|nr:MAG: hypothetical protein EA369_08550 [Bradymonadales bacterium]